jgi:hypothetical protein
MRGRVLTVRLPSMKSLLCYTVNMKKQRRAGSTHVFSISVDSETKAALKYLAKRRHAGNVSALIAELVEHEKRLEAGREFLEWVGFPGLTDEDRARIDAEIAALRPPKPPPKRKRSA